MTISPKSISLDFQDFGSYAGLTFRRMLTSFEGSFSAFGFRGKKYTGNMVGRKIHIPMLKQILNSHIQGILLLRVPTSLDSSQNSVKRNLSR